MRQLKQGESPIDFLAFDSTANRLIAADRGHVDYPGHVCAWDLSNGVANPTPLHGFLAASRGGNCLANVYFETLSIDTFELRNLTSLEIQSGPPTCVAVSDDGDFVAYSIDLFSVMVPGYERIFIRSIAQSQDEVDFRTQLKLQSLAFSPNNRLLATCGEDGFTLWDIRQRESIRADANPRGGRLAYSPSGEHILTTSDDLVFVRHGCTGDQLGTIQPLPRLSVRALVFSADGRLFATACGPIIQFWSPDDGRELRTYDWKRGTIHSLAFAPDGLTAAAGTARGEIVIWDLD